MATEIDIISVTHQAAVECLNQKEDVSHLMDSLREDEPHTDTNDTTPNDTTPNDTVSNVIRSHEDDPQLLIKIPFLQPVRLGFIKLKYVDEATCPTLLQVSIQNR